MANLCLKICNQDRVGLVLDISRVLAKQNINILSMEVLPDVMYLEIQSLSPYEEVLLNTQLGEIPQIGNVNRISRMPHQEREQELKTVMDTIGDGILAINQQEIITHFNAAAEKMMSCSSGKIIGSKIRDVFISKVPLLEILHNGMPYNNREIIVTTVKGKNHYLTSGRPIKDANGIVIGAVAVLKAMKDVEELVYSVTKPEINSFEEILHVSKVMEHTINMAKLVAQNDSTVLIRGESGTGKELFARSIHMASPRRDKVFAPVNCAALPDALLESELFGYEEGAFTGGQKYGKSGLFEYANGGTIFLDEIGELSFSLQAKLLRVLQEGKIRRVGGNREIAVDVRIITATHSNLEEMLCKNQFREDLYYRLNVIPLFIPPLRERKEDLPLLIESLLFKKNHRLKKHIKHILKPAMDKLLQHDWLGNVRELENVMERAVSFASHGQITQDDIILDHMTPTSSAIASPTSNNRKLKEVLEEMECCILHETINKYGTSRQVGKILGLSHTGVLNRMRKYNIPSRADSL
ncbi:sigma 54-interacting transcriptional regulator [Pelosinus propionicus]|uniref:HTH-type transcriptional regulatory protein TyrR n=1 Tax=Pelosinus propionicus DSM 13327 TaxID=1123291 RepID=A0A1I4IA40_9FIRM|nr:sigma 54-interacting transcriptional regulator [Pelosinus propionicus]SFL50631.1 transcriptional regulator of aroF, aroG, tyrA and aromatic amino acid transport [Pelosinus propionicus DSM 13327]